VSTPEPGRPRPIAVSGGAGGIAARCDDLVILGRLYGRAATDIGGAALRLNGYLVDPALYASGLLDPAGLARAQASLAAALDGPHGLSAVAARCGATAVELTAAAEAYRTADTLQARIGPDLTTAWRAPAAVAGAVTALADGEWGRAGSVLMAEDPGIADLTSDFLRGLAAAAWSFYPDGHPIVRSTGADPGEDAAGPPRNLEAIVSGLARRDASGQGEVDVRRMKGSDGRRYAIVDIPGTRDWTFAPDNPHIADVGTDLHAFLGERTTEENGIVAAMRAAGVRSTDRVMLVGHSQGGMLAVQTATDCARFGEFDVTHVVTAGSPVGTSAAQMPGSVQLLALENDGDAVPHLDGTPNPDRANVTTVRIARNQHDVVRNHGLATSYLPGAADVDASDNPSTRAFLGSVNGFLTAADVHTGTYQISRHN
jgi:hypothetical protein